MTVYDAWLSMVRGDDYSFDVYVKDDKNCPLDITGTDFYFTAKRSLFDTDAEAVILKDTTGGISIVDGPGGQVRIFIDAADTDSFVKKEVLRFDVQWEDGGGLIHTVSAGELVVELDVSRRT